MGNRKNYFLTPHFLKTLLFQMNLEENVTFTFYFFSFASNFPCKILWDNKNIDANILIFQIPFSQCCWPRRKKLFWGFFLSIKKSACVPNFIFHRHQQQVFLPIDITFFANIGLEYFSNNILRVFHQSQLELPDLDQNWAKTSPLLLQIFESSNCMDSHIAYRSRC